MSDLGYVLMRAVELFSNSLVLLIFATQRLRMPAADGQPYRKGEGG